MGNISPAACEEIVDTEDFVVVFEKAFTEMGAEKAGPAGYENTFG
jgi:hypothetical protein